MRSKYRLIMLLFLLLCITISSGQVKLKNIEHQVTDTGFVIFINQEDPEFVSLKINTKLPTFEQFISENLNVAYLLEWQQLALDTCVKYEMLFKVYNWFNDTNIYLKIIPVELTYDILSYRMSRKQMKGATNVEKYEFKDKFVSFKSVGGIPIVVKKFKILE